MQSKKILIFGRTGQVGWELAHKLCCLGDVVSVEYPEVDFTRPETLRVAVAEHRPAVIVNAAAYTAVDKAEEEEEKALAINGTAPGVLAEEAKKLGALLVHYSTDYVFNGSGSAAWTEENSPAPLNAYGRTKLAGDQAIATTGCNHLIFRTSWVYGARGNNFLLTMLKLAQTRPELSIVSDQIGAPTTSECIAQATADVLSQVLAPSGKGIDGRSGVYNLTNGGETSWFGFAEEIFSLSAQKLSTPTPKLTPIPTEKFPRPAERPRNSRLCPEKLAATFGVRLPEWGNGLGLVLETIQNGTGSWK
ncbi:dTDP-4-dehydrorhamnose reductase (plasmid) [Telmatobacter bradus]|uniref:dTDP-4-dehydrorhamnose reductase n=1 Tax=Telmatobacter bradus TaxID=474953 RepID=UPI003B42845F